MLTQSHPYFFSSEHAALEENARSFAENLPNLLPVASTTPMHDRALALGRAGLLQRRDTRSLALVRRHLAYHDPLADLAFIIQELGCAPLERAGGFDDAVTEARRGERIIVFGLTEPTAGSDVRGLKSTATPDGPLGQYRITGEKCFISNAPEADSAVVFATLDGTVSAFYVESPPVSAQSVASHSIGRLHFNNTPATLVSPKGLALAFQTLERARPSVAAAAVGLAARALDETIRHVQTRQQFGAPLAQLPVVRLRIAEMATDLEVATLAALHACTRRDLAKENERTGYSSAVGKVVATEAAQRVIDRAVQTHGGAGVEEGSVVEGLYRAIRPLRIYEGATDVLHQVMAEHWLGPSR